MKRFLLLFLGILGCCYADSVRDRFFKNGFCDARHQFRCFNDECIERKLFCDGKSDCKDGSDESQCNYGFHEKVGSQIESRCPTNYPFFKCTVPHSWDKCIPQHWKCDGIIDCKNGLDEKDCRSKPVNENLESIELPKSDAIAYLKELSKENRREKWSDHVHRIAVAFYLAGDTLSLTPKLASEVEIQLLSKLAQKGLQETSSADIALHIHALLVTCGNPKDFHTFDLVAELRKRINLRNYTNPFILLAVCNAGDEINENDIKKLTDGFYRSHTQFWSDTQAYAIMALTCAARNMETHYSISGFEEMILELKKNQKENGLVDNLKTTSLVMQALFAAEEKENKSLFDEEKAIKQLLLHQLKDGSFGNFINTYYTLPVLNYRHLADINANHCPKAELDGVQNNTNTCEKA